MPVFFKGQVEEITGYTEEEFLAGTPRWDEIIVPEDLKGILTHDRELRTVPGTKLDREYRIVRKDGTLRWVHDIIQTVYDTTGRSLILVGSLIDVTERKEAEAAISESRKKYQDLVENINEVIFTLDLEGTFTYLSPVVETLKGGFGYTVDELIGRSFTEILHPDDTAEVVAKYKATLAGHPKNTEFRVITRSGEIRWIQESGQQILRDGAVVGLQGLFSDVTERKNAEEALRKKEHEYRAITEISDDAIFILDYDLRIERFNSRFAECLQIDPASISGMNISDLLTGDCYEHCRSLSLEVMQTNAPSKREVLVTLAEESRWFRIRAVPLILDGEPAKILIFATDIHEITLLKQALEETNTKLNLLTGVLRHDILNYLMVIMTGKEMIEMQCEESDDLSKNLHFIEEGTDAIERLLIFSREYQSLGVKKPQWHRVSEVIEKVMKEQLFAGTTFEIQVEGYSIFADPLFSRVVFNLFENAIRHGESVTTITVRFSTENATGVLTVCDDGKGVSEEEKENIFNKRYGKHTGFGLFFAREILAITGITIAETGTAGVGAVFEMRIPEGCWRVDTESRGMTTSG